MYLLHPKNSTWRSLRPISTPRSEKCPQLFNDCATYELSMRAWSWNVTDSKKLFSTWLFHDKFRYDSAKKYLTIFHAVNLWLKLVSATAETCFSHRGYRNAGYWERNMCLNIKICCYLVSNQTNIWVIFSHLKPWIAVAEQDLKWPKIGIFFLALWGLRGETRVTGGR